MEPNMKSASLRLLASILVGVAVAACSSTAASPTPAPTTVVSPTPAPTTVVSPTPTPTPAPTATPAPPAAPTGVTMVDQTPPATCPSPFGASCYKYKVSWTEANPTGVTIAVYAVTICPAKPHCLTSTTPIPTGNLTSMGSAAASAGTLSFVVGDGETNGDGWFGSGTNTKYVYAVVVQASSSAGKSPFVLVWSW
jgi:hypothetical protein